MRTILIFVIFAAMSVSAVAKNVTLRAENEPAASVFRNLMEQTGKNFVYSSDLLSDLRVTVDVRNKPLKKALDMIFEGTDIEYRVKGKNVVLRRKERKIKARM